MKKSTKKKIIETTEMNEELFKKTFNICVEGILIINKRGKILEANKTFCSLVDYEQKSVMGKNIFSSRFISFNEKKTLFLIINNLFHKEEISRFQLNFIDKKRKKILTESTINYLDTDDGSRHYLIFVRNIEKHKKTESEIYDLKNKFFSMVEQISESIVITDTKGNIEYVNPYFEQTTGYSKKEALGKNPRILNSGKQDVKYYKNLWDTINKGKIWKGEIINKKKNGKEFIENAVILPIKNNDEKIINFIAIKHDITDLKNYEGELKKRINELEEFQNVTVDREIKLIELKKKNSFLRKKIMELSNEK